MEQETGMWAAGLGCALGTVGRKEDQWNGAAMVSDGIECARERRDRERGNPLCGGIPALPCQVAELSSCQCPL